MKLSDYYYEWLNKYKWDADRRLELLEGIQFVVENEPLQCPVCGIVGCRKDDYCGLAKELSDA